MSPIDSQSFLAHLRSRSIPHDSLGKIGEVVVQIATLQQKKHPTISNPHLLLFLGDHGLTLATEKEDRGQVSAFPSVITALMCQKYCDGEGAANILCRLHEIDFSLINAGIFSKVLPGSDSMEPKSLEKPNSRQEKGKGKRKNKDPSTEKSFFFDCPVALGTRDCRFDNAMTAQELHLACQRAKKIVQHARSRSPSCNTILLGEMGIGNTAIASLLHSIATGSPLADCTGPGAGFSPEGVAGKLKTLQICKSRWETLQRSQYVQAWGRYSSLLDIPLPKRIDATQAVLACCGGFEIAMMVSAVLEAAKEKMLIVLDGYISTVAYLYAWLMEPGITDRAVVSHVSKEPGHRILCNLLEKRPLLDLNLGLGEGSGALLAVPLLRSACALMSHLGSFPDTKTANL